jgi:hypothetical protein
MVETILANGKTILCDFDSWGDFVEFSKKDTPKDTPCNSSHATSGSRDGWTMTANYNDALSLAVSGWEEKVSEARNMSEALISKVMDKMNVPTIHFDVEGIDFDMARVHNGEPECWYRFEEHTVDNEGDAVIRITVNNMASAGIDAETIVKRGAVIAAMVELFEYAHRKVEIISHSPFKSWDSKQADIEFKINIKLANQPLDLARLMFVTGHPSMLRRLLFHAVEMYPPQMRTCGEGYGKCSELRDDAQGNIHFGQINYEDKETWINHPHEFILEQLKAQSIDVKL